MLFPLCTALLLGQPVESSPARSPNEVPTAVPWSGQEPPSPLASVNTEPDPEADVEPDITPPVAIEPELRDEPEANPSGKPKTWTAGAFVDTAYLFNSNLPDNHIYRGTVTTPRTGEFTVNLAAAYLTHAPQPREPWRFELGLQFGAGTDALYSAEPVAGGEDGAFGGPEVWKHFAMANVGGKIERSGTEIGAGLFQSPIGIGGFWSPFNWNYSPSWESNAAPFYLAGARVIQDLPAGLTAQAWLLNGWQTVGDVNKAPSYLAGLSWDHEGQAGTWNVAQFVYFGPDDVDLSPRAWRVHSDTQATWQGRRAGVGVVWDYGQERVTALPDDPIHIWSGGGIFTRFVVHEAERVDVDVAVRPDAWLDRDGRIYGENQWLVSGTGTLNVTFFDVLLARLEYRYDRSLSADGFFFRGDVTSSDKPQLALEQHTIFFSLAGQFERAFAIGAK